MDGIGVAAVTFDYLGKLVGQMNRKNVGEVAYDALIFFVMLKSCNECRRSSALDPPRGFPRSRKEAV